MKSVLKNKRGWGYIDVIVMTLCSTLFLVLALNVFTFLAQRQKLDYFAREMLQIAIMNGTYNDDVIDHRMSDLKKETGLNPVIEFSASKTIGNGKVQYGEIIKVNLTYNTSFQGFGVIDIPLTLTVQKSGVSQKYWK